MKKIWKYTLKPITLPQQVPLPEGARFLHARFNDRPRAGEDPIEMWFEVDPSHAIENGRWFRVLVTGEEIAPHLTHRATFFTHQYVLHLYEGVPA